MKLTDTLDMTFKQVLEQCDIQEQKVHTNDAGEIQAIEVKYVPKDKATDRRK